MTGSGSYGLLFFIGMVAAAAGFIGVVFLANRVLSPRNPSAGKGSPFECGIEPAGRPHAAQRLRFTTIALLFVLFDAEAILLFAVATRLRGNTVGLIEVGVFIAFLAFGLGYAWRKGALEWRS